MKNPFFDLALLLAGKHVRKPVQLMVLAAQFLSRIDRSSFTLVAIREKSSQLGRLVAAYARSEYKRVPIHTLLTLTAALLYFLNPFDLIPDALPGLGLTDDAAVLMWVYERLSSEMSAFLRWEQSTAAGQLSVQP